MRSNEQQRRGSIEESKAKGDDASIDGPKYYKLGDPIAPPPVPGSRAPATGTEMGMFGAGAGKFLDESNKKKGGPHPSIYNKQLD